MSRTAGIVLSLAVVCAAFALGVGVGRASKPETRLQQRAASTHEPRPQTNRAAILLSRLEGFRNTLSEKEKTIALLEAELEQVRAKLPPPLTPEEEKQKKERDENRKRYEHWNELGEKSRPLRDKILQRKDKALRARGLEELAAMLQSQDAEQLVVGLMLLPNLSSIICDKERFKPHVLVALTDEDPEVRRAAMRSLHTLCSPEEQSQIMLSMADDPSVEIRRAVAGNLRRLAWGKAPDQQIISALRSFLQDDDPRVRQSALDALARRPEYAEEMENHAIELSKDPEYENDMKRWLTGRRTISAEVAERLIEMYDAEANMYERLDWTHRNLSEEAKPIASHFCLGLVRDSLDFNERYQALDSLRRIGNIWVLPQLEEIARSDDAEGIEEHLASTIEHLQRLNMERR